MDIQNAIEIKSLNMDSKFWDFDGSRKPEVTEKDIYSACFHHAISINKEIPNDLGEFKIYKALRNKLVYISDQQLQSEFDELKGWTKAIQSNLSSKIESLNVVKKMYEAQQEIVNTEISRIAEIAHGIFHKPEHIVNVSFRVADSQKYVDYLYFDTFFSIRIL